MLRILFSLFMSLLFVSCVIENPQEIPGSYNGILTHRLNQKINSERVKAEVSFLSKSEAKIILVQQNNEKVEILFEDQGKKAKLISSLFGEEIFFTQVQDACFQLPESRENPTATSGEICFSNDGKGNPLITLDLLLNTASEKWSIILSKDPEFYRNEPNTNKELTLDEYLDLVNKQSFDSRIEFEKLRQARLMAQNASMNLLPHFNLMFGVNFITGGASSLSPLNLFRSIGNLAPFLIPGNWLRASEQQEWAESEAQTQILLRANTLQNSEALVYANFRSRALLESLLKQIEVVSKMRDQVKAREQVGLMAVGSSDQLEVMILNLTQTNLTLEAAIKEEQRALSLAAGLDSNIVINIKGLNSLLNPELMPSIEKLTPEYKSDFVTSVTIRAPELKQMDDIIEAARLAKKQRIWNWLDPASDPSGSIGFGLPSYLKIGSENVQIAKLQKQQQSEIIKRNAESTFDYLIAQFESIQLNEKSHLINKNRVDRLNQQFYVGMAISMFDLVTALQDLYRDEVTLLNSKYTFLVTDTKVKRLLMMGRYSDVASSTKK